MDSTNNGFYQDNSKERASAKRSANKVNGIFIPKTETLLKPFCDICKRHMIYLKDRGYECPLCGQEFTDASKDSDSISSKYASNPKIVSFKKSINKYSADFPPGATIIDDQSI